MGVLLHLCSQAVQVLDTLPVTRCSEMSKRWAEEAGSRQQAEAIARAQQERVADLQETMTAQPAPYGPASDGQAQELQAEFIILAERAPWAAQVSASLLCMAAISQARG